MNKSIPPDNKRIIEFVEKLASRTVGVNTTNQYSYQKISNEIRRDNLKKYLEMMFEMKTGTLVVSEAPGYLGMKLTGVPFSSERTLQTHPFFSDKDFKVEFGKTTEASATIVWNALDSIGKIPLMFPAFPFHPHSSGNLNSNRPPTQAELETGKIYLNELGSIFKITKFIAVGKKAQLTLSKLGIDAPYVRHPANGGANKFKAGMMEYL